ncbi:MAG: hypothetical protein HQ551_07850 [Desulfobacteraceae bacterium]|nr:hypothetical protein [Desulfobacteraceae bacterium]
MNINKHLVCLLLFVFLVAPLSAQEGMNLPDSQILVNSAIKLITEGIELIEDREEHAALNQFKKAEALAPDVPIVQYHLGRGYELLDMLQEAATFYFKSAVADYPSTGKDRLGSNELKQLMRRVSLPGGYSAEMDLENYRRAMDIAPWWPAAYWALAISNELSGNRAEAIRDFLNFLAVMKLAGLEKPYREWMIETDQMRYQVSIHEANFLVEAGFLSSRWKSATSGGRLSDIAQVFEKVDPELWRLAGEAMRNAMRFKTLHVSKDGRGDYNRIQDAIDSMERDGGAGRILVAPGTYREKVTLTNSARIVIQATERGRSFVEGPPNSPALHIRGGGRIVIDGIVITGFSQETAVVEGTGQITIKYTDFKGDTRMGLIVCRI